MTLASLMGEFAGTLLLVLLGNCTVANVLLKGTKGEGSGYTLIVIGWAAAIFVAVFCVASYSGAHLNPVVSIALAVAGKFAWANVPGYIVAQMLGGMVSAFFTWLFYKPHYDMTENAGLIQATFCTAPNNNNRMSNLFSEVAATFILVFAIMHLAAPDTGLGGISALPVALLILGIGISFGGTTGYAMNPARDLAPRIIYGLLPIKNKGDSGWDYAWIPLVGPLIGGVLAAVSYLIEVAILGSSFAH